MNSSASELTDLDFKKIIARRDTRFDGRFFFGVRTTRIYCRVSCPARPKPENILVFRSPSEAERLGYRPCLRCRPDAAPGSLVFHGTGNTVARALRLIENSDDEGLSVATLAVRLGVTDRHLRRLFELHLGAAPIEIMITKRLHLAKRLITETDKQIGAIALAVGFQSIRRFNDAFKKLFSRSPSQFRGLKKTGHEDPAPADALHLTLAVHDPYDWETTLGFLGRHEAFGIEVVDGSSYKRYVSRNNKNHDEIAQQSYGSVEVRRPRNLGPLQVHLTGFELSEVRTVLYRISQLFDTRHNPAHLSDTTNIKPLGIRVPGCFDAFEVAVSIVTGQLISTAQAKARLKKIILRYGILLNSSKAIYAFPPPAVLMNAPLEEVGLTRGQAAAIRHLARSVEMGEIDLSETADPVLMRERLHAIKGIGPWTVELVAMRCWADPDAFPRSDLIIRRALDRTRTLEKNWTSSRAYLTHCLWREASSPPAAPKQIKRTMP